MALLHVLYFASCASLYKTYRVMMPWACWRAWDIQTGRFLWSFYCWPFSASVWSCPWLIWITVSGKCFCPEAELQESLLCTRFLFRPLSLQYFCQQAEKRKYHYVCFIAGLRIRNSPFSMVFVCVLNDWKLWQKKLRYFTCVSVCVCIYIRAWYTGPTAFFCISWWSGKDGRQ